MFFQDNNSNLILVKDDQSIINVNNGSIIEYKGFCYISESSYIESLFIGRIEYPKITNYEIDDIYITPIFIFLYDEWIEIINLKKPLHRYFKYPHLLVLSHVYPQYCIHTVKQRNDLSDLVNCKKIELPIT